MARPTALLWSIVLCLVGGSVACGPNAIPRSSAEQAMFGVASFRIHPSFTQISTIGDSHKPNGIEAVLEFLDGFGDPTRASGKLRFELYNFISADSDHRGARLAMWSTSLDTREDQMSHWDTATRAYTFELVYPQIKPNVAYVLLVQYDREDTRLFSRLVLEPPAKDGFQGDRITQHAPPDAPSHGL